MNLILLFASQPLFGQVLPGLVPPLQPLQAALLYHAMLRDQLRACAQVPDTVLRICFAPGLLPGSLEGDLQWEIQRGDTAQERLGNAFASAFRSGARKALALGITPEFLDAPALTRAFQDLDTHSAVLGKGLVGLNRPLPSLLRADEEQRLGTAAALGLKVSRLEDALSFESLAVLKAGLAENPEKAPLCALCLASMA